MRNLGDTSDIFMFFSTFQEVPDENYDLPYHHQNDTNGDAVMIKMDVPGREEPSFPKEKWKTFIGEYACVDYITTIHTFFTS